MAGTVRYIVMQFFYIKSVAVLNIKFCNMKI